MLFIYMSLYIWPEHEMFYVLNTFVRHIADLLLQLAMRGPTGPMGLTGRPGPLVCILHLRHLVVSAKYC